MEAGGETDRIANWADSLRVGVTGHRHGRLAGADPGLIAASARDVLGAIAAVLPDAPSLHLVSSLAEGADSIVADAAHALGWRLDVVLPLPREDYAADFAAGTARDDHHARLAAADRLLELPLTDCAGGDRTAAYERAGRVVLAQSDLLIAIWDGKPARGRGGAAQIIAEAVLRGIPIIHIDPAAPSAPMLLWDGLGEHDFGQQSVETVARAGLERLPDLIASLTRREPDALADDLVADLERPRRRPRRSFAFAYPLLLAVMGVRRFRFRELVRSRSDPAATLSATLPESETTNAVARRRLDIWFLRADANAVVEGQTFRSAYVANFALAALAVIVSLSGLALPHGVKPVIALTELAAIGTILVVTRIGLRANWHRRWLDQRHLAERLRCLRIASRLGELGLRRGRATEGRWVTWFMHAAARMTGLPAARIDERYLDDVRVDLLALIDGQIRYLEADAARMRTLEHRMHRLGTSLFGATALICTGIVMIEISGAAMWLTIGDPAMHAISTAATIASAALPACGAAIYGIRMQSDFAGIAERGATLAARLRALRTLTADDPLRFDLLSRRMRRATDLLTDDLSNWLHTYRARPLALPG